MGAQGTAVVDFGAWPGASQAQVDVAAASMTTSKAVEAWARPQDDTAEHSVDEHVVEQLKITAGNIVGGVGFTIYVECLNGNAYGTFNLNWVWN